MAGGFGESVKDGRHGFCVEGVFFCFLALISLFFLLWLFSLVPS